MREEISLKQPWHHGTARAGGQMRLSLGSCVGGGGQCWNNRTRPIAREPLLQPHLSQQTPGALRQLLSELFDKNCPLRSSVVHEPHVQPPYCLTVLLRRAFRNDTSAMCTSAWEAKTCRRARRSEGHKISLTKSAIRTLPNHCYRVALQSPLRLLSLPSRR